jgi:hypothetical protein
VFTDDFDRGTQFLVTGASGQFKGPGIDVSGVRVLRFGDRVIALGMRGGALVSGRGTCRYGPATFRALRIFPLPPTRWLLVDMTP